MKFDINYDLLEQSRITLLKRENLYWIIGGAGSGKTVISRSLSERYNIPVYDMDACVYGTYHSRFTQEHHPVNSAWASSQNGLAWLLDMTWDEFNNFNRAALVEYLNLMSEDICMSYPNARLIIDGGVCNPSILTQVLSPHQIICLAMPEQSSTDIWEGIDERKSMKESVCQLPNPKEAWKKFLEFDGKITSTILKECRESDINILSRDTNESVGELTSRAADAWHIH
jgi:hypothetical protein